MPPRMLLRQNIHSAKKGEMGARFSLSFSCSRSSSPWCPQLILSLFRSFFERTFTKRKRTDTERVRETLNPRLKREEYQEQHTFSLSLEMYTEKERDKREKQEENKKHTSRDNRGFFPNAQQRILFSIKNVSVCSNIKL